MVKEILHSNSSNSVRPTTHLQNTLQWVCTCTCFHLENPKGNLFPHARAFFGEDFTPTHLCSLHFPSRTCAGACYCRKDWVPMLVSDQRKIQKGRGGCWVSDINWFWRMGNCQLGLTFVVISMLMLHFKKKRAQPAPKCCLLC